MNGVPKWAENLKPLEAASTKAIDAAEPRLKVTATGKPWRYWSDLSLEEVRAEGGEGVFQYEKICRMVCGGKSHDSTFEAAQKESGQE